MIASAPLPSTALQVFEPVERDVYSIETVVLLTRTPRHQIAVYCRHGLIAPVTLPEQDGWWFDHRAIRELRQFEMMRTEYELNLEGLRVVTHLRHELARLRQEIRELRQLE